MLIWPLICLEPHVRKERFFYLKVRSVFAGGNTETKLCLRLLSSIFFSCLEFYCRGVSEKRARSFLFKDFLWWTDRTVDFVGKEWIHCSSTDRPFNPSQMYHTAQGPFGVSTATKCRPFQFPVFSIKQPANDGVFLNHKLPLSERRSPKIEPSQTCSHVVDCSSRAHFDLSG